MTRENEHILPFDTEAEARPYRDIGWITAPAERQNGRGVALTWGGKGEPKLPGHPAVRT